MIKSDRERKKAEELLASSRDMVRKHEELLRSLNHKEEEIETALQTQNAAILQLEQELEEYDTIREKQELPEYGINQLGKYLIAARIAKDLSQREFAGLLKVNEALVSRDERNEYQGITVERFARIAEALELEISIIAKLKENRVPACT